MLKHYRIFLVGIDFIAKNIYLLFIFTGRTNPCIPKDCPPVLAEYVYWIAVVSANILIWLALFATAHLEKNRKDSDIFYDRAVLLSYIMYSVLYLAAEFVGRNFDHPGVELISRTVTLVILLLLTIILGRKFFLKPKR